jgi:nucleoside-diphosphate-sugar epimerase
LGNLDARRDLTYVSDTVDGFLRAGEVRGIEGEVFNLGTGEEVRIGDLAELTIMLINRPVTIEVDPARLRPEKSEVQRLLSDNRRAKDRLNWTPIVGLREGLVKTIEWIQSHMDHYSPGQYQL